MMFFCWCQSAVKIGPCYVGDFHGGGNRKNILLKQIRTQYNRHVIEFTFKSIRMVKTVFFYVSMKTKTLLMMPQAKLKCPLIFTTGMMCS